MKKALLLAATLLCGASCGSLANALTIEKVTSPSGIEAWLVEDHKNPIIATDFSFAAGSASDPSGKEGLASMVSGLLDEGAGDLDAQAFQGRLEDLAVGMTFSSDADNFTGRLKTLTDNRDEAFKLLHLALTKARFDSDAIARVRGQMQVGLQQEEQDPPSLAGRAFSAALFPGHPYGRENTEASLQAITDGDLKGWVGGHLSRDHLVVSVVGDITPQQLAALLDSTFADMPSESRLAPVAEAQVPVKGSLKIIRKQIPQSVVNFGEAGVKRDDPDWYTAYVMNYILGGGSFSSRLMTEVRVKRGLAYGAYTGLEPYEHGGIVAGEVATRNDKVAEALKVVKDELRKMGTTDVTVPELASAKTYLNGAFPLQMDSTTAIAALLSVVQRDHLGIDYFDRRAGLIDKVTAADIRRVGAKLLDPDKLTVVIVGDPKGMAQGTDQ
jgi:zinc protease